MKRITMVLGLALAMASGCAMRVSGVVRDQVTGEPLPGVSVVVGDRSTTTDALGRYRLKVRKERSTLVVGANGYESTKMVVGSVDRFPQRDVALRPKSAGPTAEAAETLPVVAARETSTTSDSVGPDPDVEDEDEHPAPAPTPSSNPRSVVGGLMVFGAPAAMLLGAATGNQAAGVEVAANLIKGAATIDPELAPVGQVVDVAQQAAAGGRPSSFAATGASFGGTRSKADTDAAVARCQNDRDYTRMVDRAQAGADGRAAPGMAASYCAAVKLTECFINNGLYKEAGAETETTLAQLQSLSRENRQHAAQVGTTCP